MVAVVIFAVWILKWTDKPASASSRCQVVIEQFESTPTAEMAQIVQDVCGLEDK